MKNKVSITKIANIFKLRAEGYSLNEIASKTQITSESVRQTLARVLKIVEDFKKAGGES